MKNHQLLYNCGPNSTGETTHTRKSNPDTKTKNEFTLWGSVLSSEELSTRILWCTCLYKWAVNKQTQDDSLCTAVITRGQCPEALLSCSVLQKTTVSVLLDSAGGSQAERTRTSGNVIDGLLYEEAVPPHNQWCCKSAPFWSTPRRQAGVESSALTQIANFALLPSTEMVFTLKSTPRRQEAVHSIFFWKITQTVPLTAWKCKNARLHVCTSRVSDYFTHCLPRI